MPETIHSVDGFLKEKDERLLNDARNGNGIKYDNITGSAFYNSSFQAAHLYKNGKKVGTFPIKINFLTNEIYFLQGEKELVVEDGRIDSIVFFNTPDTAIVISVVTNLLLKDKTVDAFVQILNKGDWKLLKYTKKELSSSEAGLTQKKYSFNTESYYYLKYKQKVERIKRLDRETLLSYLPSYPESRRWIEIKKTDFRKEQDVVAFLNYYNNAFSGY